MKHAMIFSLFFVSCGTREPWPGSFKKDLLGFSQKESIVSARLPIPGKFGSLWIGFNPFNARTHIDTLFVDANTWLFESRKYEGGFEFENDTLFLYVKTMDNLPNKDSVFYTLSYTILKKDRNYKHIALKLIE